MSQTPYGFDTARFRAARTAATVPHIARTAGVSERAVSYLAGTRTPRPGVLVLLAQAVVGVTPADLCTVEAETLRHHRLMIHGGI
ncbi:hypothetical protein ABZ743_32420 [Streptomyces sp. NPDC006662]|uniref:hypothetical protein n=1 Tax=Streptomyces sp. NPDC006662 TaxID=3156902 RepID=UPI0033E4D85B